MSGPTLTSWQPLTHKGILLTLSITLTADPKSGFAVLTPESSDALQFAYDQEMKETVMPIALLNFLQTAVLEVEEEYLSVLEAYTRTLGER